MTLEFLGKDPQSDDGQSPTVWRDPDTGDYVLRGWKIDAQTRAAVGDDPPGELTMRFPARMMRFFPEVTGGTDVS
ncbi:hypothetical protein Acsp04_63570 [Actinomadura sp. NBRC 104425]|uniref:hypothetical protein n=1 Tax=Actinomadura sp. NBRC 104425 TaxID=3032204 RepID=UPI0024A5637A|nr:hypothetical protein [Actinomadura sp. NBRC 104425]GLZ16122.1 hypothetical protein Acsp04_63570 [Actinomadura sp. NBRC 104425]